MSPLCESCVLQPGIPVIQGNLTVQSLVDLNLGAGEAEAPWLRGNLQAPSIPLHDVIVADDALVAEGADALEVFRRGTPSLGGIARGTGEAAVVVGDKETQDPVGRVRIAGLRQSQFAAQAILQYAPEPFHAAFGLRTLRGNE